MCDKREKWNIRSLFVYTEEVVGGARNAVARRPRRSVGHLTQ
jgi:hypothetical protein